MSAKKRSALVVAVTSAAFAVHAFGLNLLAIGFPIPKIGGK
jgi:hypothetical protein